MCNTVKVNNVEKPNPYFTDDGTTMYVAFKLPGVRNKYEIKVRARNHKNGLVGELYTWDNALKISYPTVTTTGAVDIITSQDPAEAQSIPTSPYVYKLVDDKAQWVPVLPHVFKEDNKWHLTK
jgi:hypothetical protein